MKISLIPNWTKAWKYASVQLPILGLVLMTIADFVQQSWTQLPPQFQKELPHATTIAMIMFGLSLVGRILSFTSKETTDANA